MRLIIPYQNTRDFIKKCKFCDSSHPRGKYANPMKKFSMFAIKIIISKFAAHVLVKKTTKFKRLNLINSPTCAIMDFVLKLLIFRNLHTLTNSRMKTPIGQKLYPRMEFLFHTKLIPELNVTLLTLTILKKLDPEPDLCPVNRKISTYNNSRISVLGKCSLTLEHKKDRFEVSFIVVDSKSVPILRLTTSESLNLIKRISAVNLNDEQFLSEFFD